MSSVTSMKQEGPRRSYITMGIFNNDIFSYQTTINGRVLSEPPHLSPVEGATAGNCPKGRFLYENGKKLFPTTNVGISTYMVGVYDPVTFLKGFIDPNSKLFSPMHQDKPSTALPVTENNVITFGVNPENGEFDQGPGVLTLANSVFGAKVDISGAMTVGGDGSFAQNVDVSGAMVVDGNGTFNSSVEVANVMNAGEVQQEGFRLVPTGSLISYIAAAAPGGWLLCDGSAVSRVTYSRLFGVIGTTYGSGDNVNTFNLPDLRGRVPLGVGSGPGLTPRSLNNPGGAETHTLSASEIPAHSHPVSDPGHKHVMGRGDGGTTNDRFGQSSGAFPFANDNEVYSAYTGITVDNNEGGGGAHNNMQPFIVLNFIIKW